MICEIRLCSPDSCFSSAAGLSFLLLYCLFFTSRFFFCHTLLAAISLLVFLLAFRVNWQYGEGPDEVNVTDKQAANQTKAKIFITIINTTGAKGILAIDNGSRKFGGCTRGVVSKDF